MSSIKLESNASGTGVFTIASPNSNTNRTLTLPDQTGTVLTGSGAIGVNASAPTNSVAIDSSGNVGIGTSSPAANTRLNVASSGETKINMTTTGTGSGTRIFLNNQNGYDLEILSSGDASGVTNLGLASNSQTGVGANYILSGTKLAIGTYNNYETIFGTNNAERMRISSSGDVGIGTSSPATLSNYKFLTTNGSSGSGLVCQSNGTNRLSVYSANTDGYYDADSTHIFRTGGIFGGTERARITSGGYFKASNTGTYNASTQADHELCSDNANNAIVQLKSTSTSYDSAGVLFRFNRNTTNNTFYALSYYNDAASAYKFRVADSGNCTNTNGSYGTISDVKLKQDIVDAGSQWNDIKGLRFRKYRLKSDVEVNPDAKPLLGLVAQEAELVSPGLIEEHKDTKEEKKTREVEKTREIPAVLDEDGNEVEPARTETYTETEEYTETVDLGTTTKSIKTSILYMKAVKALQEAMTRIEALEAEVAALKGQA